MRLTLVGNRRGKRVILWGQVCKIASLLAPLPIIVAEGAYWFVRKEWSWAVFMLGLAVGIVIALIILAVAWITPIQRLPLISDKQ
jgi:hypothetical protein